MELEKPMPSRCGFVFELAENAEKTGSEGVLAYRLKVDTQPFEARNGLFVIGVSLKNIVVGPYRVVGKQYYDDKIDLGFVRLTSSNGQIGLRQELCPWRIPVKPEPSDAKILYGLPWPYICERLKIDPQSWDTLRLTELLDNQFDELVRILQELNEFPYSFANRVSMYPWKTQQEELAEWSEIWAQEMADARMMDSEYVDDPEALNNFLEYHGVL